MRLCQPLLWKESSLQSPCLQVCSQQSTLAERVPRPIQDTRIHQTYPRRRKCRLRRLEPPYTERCCMWFRSITRLPYQPHDSDRPPSRFCWICTPPPPDNRETRSAYVMVAVFPFPSDMMKSPLSLKSQSHTNPSSSTGPPNLALSLFRPIAKPTTGGTMTDREAEFPNASVMVSLTSYVYAMCTLC